MVSHIIESHLDFIESALNITESFRLDSLQLGSGGLALHLLVHQTGHFFLDLLIYSVDGLLVDKTSDFGRG